MPGIFGNSKKDSTSRVREMGEISEDEFGDVRGGRGGHCRGPPRSL